MINSYINNQLKKNNVNTITGFINVIREECQKIILYSLSKTDFFKYVAFYGGTCLRLFHNLNRYHYEATESYPAHTLLIEATLANSTNQRRMEMEPVSRHLGDYLLSHNEEAYCLFATTFLHVNVVADFRNRKTAQYYSNDGEKSVDGMKIIPCNTAELKTIISNGISYRQLYTIFEQAYCSNIAPNLWYEQKIKNCI